MTTPLWRTDNETKQPLGRVATFTYTFAADGAADIVTLAGRMAEGWKVSLVVDTADAFINFDADATGQGGATGTILRSMLVPAGAGYSEENLFIGSRISAQPATAGGRPRIRGVIWGR